MNIEQVAEFRVSPKLQQMFRTKKFQSTLETLRSSQFVEYEEVHELKMAVLEDLFRVFKRRHLQPRTRRGRAFIRFVQQSPDFLTRFCTFKVLSEYFQGFGMAAMAF